MTMKCRNCHIRDIIPPNTGCEVCLEAVRQWRKLMKRKRLCQECGVKQTSRTYCKGCKVKRLQRKREAYVPQSPKTPPNLPEVISSSILPLPDPT
jgi:hypothetical protein